MNALRRAYFGDFGQAECDEITAPNPQISGVLVFERGCSSDSKVLVIASFDTVSNKTIRVPVSWPSGTQLADSLAITDPLMLIVSQRRDISVMLDPLAAVVLVPIPVYGVPPMVTAVSPSHGSTASWSSSGYQNVTLRFDRIMKPSVISAALWDGQPANFRCTADCSEIALELDMATVDDGFHTVVIEKRAAALDGPQLYVDFSSTFMVDRSMGAIAKPRQHHMSGLICSNFTQLCHNATGADWLRVKNVGGAWSEWRAMEAVSDWQSVPGEAVLVQYHAHGSASFVVGDCIGLEAPCFASWHQSMNLRGEFNAWGQAESGGMVKIGHYTWATNLTLDRFVKAKFAPYQDSP